MTVAGSCGSDNEGELDDLLTDKDEVPFTTKVDGETYTLTSTTFEKVTPSVGGPYIIVSAFNDQVN